MDVFNKLYLKNTTIHKLEKKNSKNYSVYEDKSDFRRKVVVVREALIRKCIIKTIFGKFWYMFYYCRPTMDLHKKSLLKYRE